MSKTNDLRKLVQSKLKTVCEKVYFEIADEKEMYPHCVFSFRNIDTSDTAFARGDITMTIDVWDKNKHADNIEDMCDSIENLFNAQNMPQTSILPTFFLMSRITVIDDDKTIRHRVINVLIQNYERGEANG